MSTKTIAISVKTYDKLVQAKLEKIAKDGKTDVSFSDVIADLLNEHKKPEVPA